SVHGRVLGSSAHAAAPSPGRREHKRMRQGTNRASMTAVRPRVSSTTTPVHHRTRQVASAAHPPYLNRELSWLEFNARVLHLARDERSPVLERVRFLAIFASNLDEFF